MKITMLGISGSGKTSLMAALHERFSNGRVDQYSILPTNRTGAIENIIIGDWDAISFANNNYEWHAGTTETTVWSFDLVHENQVITQFDWIDYRGGILTDIARNAGDDEDKVELINHLFLSNGVIITVDAYLLTYYTNLNQARQETGINIIQSILEKFRVQYPDREMTFIIALTKADTVAEEWKTDGYKPLVERAAEAFNFLGAYSHDWNGGIVPISAVGGTSVERELISKGNLRELPKTKDTIIEYPTPENVEHLLFYCVGNILEQMKEIAESKLVEREEEIEKAMSRSNTLGSFWAWLVDGTNYREIANKLMKEQKQDKESLILIEQYINPLIQAATNKVREI